MKKSVVLNKDDKSIKGGLTKSGREKYNRETGSHLKPPVTKRQAQKSPSDANRRNSFCSRMKGVEGPMRDEKGRPTRKALALKRWDC